MLHFLLILYYELTINTINYEKFWARAMTDAQSAAQRMSAPSYVTEQQRKLTFFPKVFVYDLPRDLSEGFNPSKASDREIFGPSQKWGANDTWKRYGSWWKLVSSKRRAQLNSLIF